MDDRVDSDSHNSKSSDRRPPGCVIVIVILLLSGGLIAGLYIALRPDHAIRPPTPWEGRAVLPCPKMGGMNEEYTEDTCRKQSRCEWKSEKDDFPQQCRFNLTSKEDNWSIELESADETGEIRTLSKSTQKLNLQITCRTANELRFKITESSAQRYEVPNTALPISDVSIDCSKAEYKYEISNDGWFYLIHNKVTMISIPLDAGLVFDEQFMQITLQLNSSTNYGLGEHNHKRLKLDMNHRTWAIYTRDVAPVDDWNLYGAQPYFMTMNSKNKSVIGTLLKNSNAMDVYLQPDPLPSITYRVIGGVLDFHFFVAKSPESVTRHYTNVVGRPLLPPYWSLGFQLSRWGYQDLNHVKSVVTRNQEAGIPLDVVYGDIDYMAHKFDFTYNNTGFAGLPEYVQELRLNNTRYIIILDPGIGIENDKILTLDGGKYHALDEGLQRDVFVKESNGSNLVGKVWPGLVHYPDFTLPAAEGWWKDQIWDFYNNSRNVTDSGVQFDGLWVDMNEPSNFRDGADAEKVCNMNNKLNSPPYIPGSLLGNSLVDKTFCMDADLSWGKHYNVHSLYGHSMAMATNRALSQLFPTKRPFVLTRSTYTGTNSHAIHWLGDNQSQWRQIPWSIVSMLEFSLFGFSMTGSDICGFWYNTTESMCQRWMQLGAFYPFARNHNAGFNGEDNFLHLDQDPANFGDDMIRSSREVLLTRYRLLPYLYTLMYKAHVFGDTVARPLFFEFMDDIETHNVERQFMWGSGLLISPCMEENSEEVRAYFPAGVWYDYYSGEEVTRSGSWQTLYTPLDRINLHVRGGSIIPMQKPSTNTEESKKLGFEILIALDEEEKASGEWYLDDGDASDPIKMERYSLVNVAVASSKVTVSISKKGYTSAPNPNVTTVQVLGLKRRVSSLLVNESPNGFEYQHTGNMLEITLTQGLDYRLNHTITWGSV